MALVPLRCTVVTGSGYSSYSPKKFGFLRYQRLPLSRAPSQKRGLATFLLIAIPRWQPRSSRQALVAVCWDLKPLPAQWGTDTYGAI